MKPKRFAARALTRAPGGKPPRQRTILICYDGEKTEEDYFRGWKKALGTKGAVVSPYYVRSGGNALDAVKETVKIKDADGDHDECWCVCDIDDTSVNDLAKATALASKSGIRLGLSVRCFEVWIALHWPGISTAPIANEREARKLVARNFPEYLSGPKTVPFSILFDRTDEAIKNADWLTAQKHTNPSTSVHQLIRILNGLMS